MVNRAIHLGTSWGGGSTTTLDPAQTSSNLSLDATHLILTGAIATVNGDVSLSTTSHSSGKYYVEITQTTPVGLGTVAWGIGNTSIVLVNTGLGSANGAGIYTDGSVYIGGSPAGTTGLSSNAAGAVWGVKIDMDGNTFAINLNGGSFSSPISISTGTVPKPWLFASQGYKAAGVSSVTTHNFNPSSFPSGYGAF